MEEVAQQQPPSRSKKVFDYLKGKKKISDNTPEEFEKSMSDPERAQKVFDYLKSLNKVSDNNLDEFQESMGVKKKEEGMVARTPPLPSPESQDAAVSSGAPSEPSPEPLDINPITGQPNPLPGPRVENAPQPAMDPLTKQMTDIQNKTGAKEFFLSERDRIENGPPVSASEKVQTAAGNFNKPVIQLASAPLKALGVVSNQIDRLINKATGEEPEKIESNPYYTAGQWIDKKALDWGLTATSPKLDNSILYGDIPQALGSAISIMSTAGAGEGTALAEGVSTAGALGVAKNVAKEVGKTVISRPVVAGGLIQGTAEYDAAKAAGLSEEEAFKVFLKNYAVGQTEGIPLERALARINTLSGGKLMQVLKAGTKGGLEEALQEGISAVLTNNIAQGSYDKNRGLYEDLVKQMGVGAFVGFILPGIGKTMQSMTPEAQQKTKEDLHTVFQQEKQVTAPQGDLGFNQQKNAVQEPAAAQVDVGQPSGDGQALASGNPQGQEAPQGQGQNQETQAVNANQETTPVGSEAIPGDGTQNTEGTAGGTINQQTNGQSNEADQGRQEDQVLSTEAPVEAKAATESITQPKGTRKRTLLNRGYEGVTDDQVKSSIARHGLTYKVVSHAQSKQEAKDFINEVGLDNALSAVRNNQVDGGKAAFIWSTAIDDVHNKRAQATDPKELEDLANLEGDLIDEFDKKVHQGGEFISALKEVYLSSDFRYNVDYQIKKYKELNHGYIPKDVEAKFKELDQQLKAANEKLQDYEANKGKAASQEKLKTIRQDIQNQRAARAKEAQAKRASINQFFDSLKAKKDPNTLNNVFQVIGDEVRNGAVEAMRKAILAGHDVATAVQAGIDHIKEHYRGTDFNEQDFINAVQPGMEKLMPKRKGDLLKPKMKDGKLTIPNKLIRQLVEEGATDIEQLTQQVHDRIKTEMPEVTEREVRDAITRYGESRTLSQEDINVKIREIKRVGKLVSALEDVQNKLRPLKSGLEKDKLTDRERTLRRQVNEGMKDIPMDDVQLDKEWRNALDAVKTRLRNQITDLEAQIEKGEKSPKRKGIKYDEEAKALKEQRDRLKEALEATEGKRSLSDEQRVRNAMSAVESTIAEYERRIKDRDFSEKIKSIAPTTPELRESRAKRDQLKDIYKQMQKESGILEKKRLDNYKKGLKRSAERYAERIKNKDFVNVKKLAVAPDEEALKLRTEKRKIKEQFEVEQEKNRLKNRPLNEKIWDMLVDVLTLPKSLLATFDMSAPFRQGAVLSAANPIAAAGATKEMFHQAFSGKQSEKWLNRLRESPEYDLMKQAELYISEPTAKLTAREDQFMSNLAGKIPVIGSIIRGSERAYTGYLNKLRIDVFTSGVEQFKQAGLTPEANPEEYKALADFINNASGRGNLGGLEKAAPILNAALFSPRYVASRFNLLNPVKYAKMPPRARRLALKNMAAYIGFSVMVLAFAKAGGADVEDDPRSSDFGKIRIGNTRYDIWAGFQQPVRFIAQLITGERKNPRNGRIIKLNGKKSRETRGDLILRFLRTKLSPTTGTAVNLLEGTDMFGQPVTIEGELIKNAVPLYIQDLSKLYDKEDPTGLLESAIPALFGIGVQTYDDKKKKKP